MGQTRAKFGVRKSKHQLFLILFTAVLLSLLAPPSFSVDRQKNDDAIRSILQQLQTFNVLSGKFIQYRNLVGIPKSLQSSGGFLFWRAHGLYWHIDKPFSHALTYTPDDILFWGEATKLGGRQKKSVIEKQISKTLLAIFGGDVSQIQEMFELTWHINDAHWEIDLIPKTYAAKKSISNVIVKGSRHIEELVILSRGGDKTRILFSDVIPAAHIPILSCKYFSEASLSLCQNR